MRHRRVAGRAQLSPALGKCVSLKGRATRFAPKATRPRRQASIWTHAAKARSFWSAYVSPNEAIASRAGTPMLLGCDPDLTRYALVAIRSPRPGRASGHPVAPLVSVLVAATTVGEAARSSRLLTVRSEARLQHQPAVSDGRGPRWN
jgi:hypothetical protein